jgi:hypothetical protein
MDEYSSMYLMTLNAKVTAIVPDDDVVTNALPFGVMVQKLVKITVISECLSPHLAVEL